MASARVPTGGKGGYARLGCRKYRSIVFSDEIDAPKLFDRDALIECAVALGLIELGVTDADAVELL